MTVAIPSAHASSHGAANAHERELLNAVTGDLGRSPTSLAYRLAMIPLLAFILMLPLVYVALIAAAGWGVIYHAMNHINWITDIRAKVFGTALYLGPLLGGLFVVAFMIKPIFAPRRAREANPYSLERKQEPVLFAFVERLANMLGAPTPQRIEVNCVPNASASMGDGLLSVFSRNLTLTIGTPLIAAMNTRELAGILAHELGHFSQGAGMRSTYLIHRINGWFARVVYERDAWDDRLNEHARNGKSGWTMMIAWCCILCAWLTRRVLWLLLMAAHMMTCVMLRRMEFDADDKQIRLVGSRTFVTTFRRIAEISWAFDQRADQMYQARIKGRLAEDLPGFVAGTIEAMPEEIREQVRASIDHEEQSWFSSHPSPAARMKQALAAETEGHFRIEQPASVLLRNYEVVCRWTTLGFYHAHLDEDISAEELQPTETLLQRTKHGLAAFHAGGRFYQYAMSPLHPLPLEGIDAGAGSSVAKLKDALVRARKFMLAKATDVRVALQELHAADDTLLTLMQAKSLNDAGLKFTASDFGLTDARKETLSLAITSGRERLAASRSPLQPFDQATVLRLAACLRLLEQEELEAMLPQRHQLAEQAAALIQALRSLNDATPLMDELRMSQTALLVLLHNFDEGKDNETFKSRLNAQGNAVHEELQRLVVMLREAPYPLEHSRERFSIADAAVTDMPPRHDSGRIAEVADGAIHELFELRREIMDRLALIGQQVEAACDLQPLPEPPEPAEEMESKDS